MIRSGEKQEEYRSISDYYSSRIKNLISPFTWCANTTAWTEAVIRGAGEEGFPFQEVVLRAGYNPTSPAIMISGKITIGSGRPEWGAEPGEEYYIFHIELWEDLITDERSHMVNFKRLKVGSLIHLKSEEEVKKTVKALRAAGFSFTKPGKYVICIAQIPKEV
jgi:hypothetical protein